MQTRILFGSSIVTSLSIRSRRGMTTSASIKSSRPSKSYMIQCISKASWIGRRTPSSSSTSDKEDRSSQTLLIEITQRRQVELLALRLIQTTIRMSSI